MLKLTHKVMCAAIVIGRDCPLEELAVTAWRMWPDSFGMEGYPQYPHFQYVISKVYGDAGLVNMGWLAIVHGVVSVTERGKKELDRVLKTVASPRVLNAHLVGMKRGKNDGSSSKKEGIGERGSEKEFFEDD